METVEPPPSSSATARSRSSDRGLLDAHGDSAVSPLVVFGARIGVVAVLVVAGVIVGGGSPASPVRLMVWLAAVAGLVLAGFSYRFGWDPASNVGAWMGVAGAIGGGAVLGSAGYVSIAVSSAVALAWVMALSGRVVAARVGPVAAAVIGVGLGLSSGRSSGPDVVAACTLVALGGFAAWAGAMAADEVGLADVERTELRRLRAEMVTTISHELRTPLTVIQGATATLSRRWDVLTEPERLDLVDVLTDNVASLDSSIIHFADAARLERGHFTITPEWVVLEEVLATARARRAGPLAGHDVRTDLAMETVWADRTALERILEHLLLNAARFSPVGLPISIRAAGGPGEVTLTVADQGQGISPRLLSSVWEPLQRGDVADTGVSRGAGLGLPIVRELARLHGGEATLSSVRGRGTTVSVVLPQPAGGGPGGVPLDAPTGRAAGTRRGVLSRRSG